MNARREDARGLSESNAWDCVFPVTAEQVPSDRRRLRHRLLVRATLEQLSYLLRLLRLDRSALKPLTTSAATRGGTGESPFGYRCSMSASPRRRPSKEVRNAWVVAVGASREDDSVGTQPTGRRVRDGTTRRRASSAPTERLTRPQAYGSRPSSGVLSSARSRCPLPACSRSRNQKRLKWISVTRAVPPGASLSPAPSRSSAGPASQRPGPAAG